MWRVETNHVYVDADGTLLIWPTVAGSPRAGETPKINQRLVDAIKSWQKTTPAAKLVIWTKGGLAHAEMAAKLCGLDGVCIAKPDCIIDDTAPEMWLRKTPIIDPSTFK